MTIVGDDELWVEERLGGRNCGKFAASFDVVEEKDILGDAGLLMMDGVAVMNLKHGAAEFEREPQTACDHLAIVRPYVSAQIHSLV